MVRITVLTSSYRLLYKKEQIEALSQQTFRDFEWIVVDDHYQDNAPLSTPFPCIHMPPAEIFQYFALGAAMNDGLVRASGKYVFFMNDYVIPKPGCLARHWAVQEKMGGCLLSGRATNPSGTPTTYNGEVVKVEDYRMALFKYVMFPSTLVGDGLIEAERDGVQCWWAGRNDSAPLKAILDCNGFEEAFDGRWGGHDADMANRLMTYGLKYYLDKKSECLEYDHPRGAKKQVRTEAQQQNLQNVIINPRVERGDYMANKEWLVMLPRNLKEERGEGE